MKTNIVLFSAVLMITGACSLSETDTALSGIDRTAADFRTSTVYEDLQNEGIQFDWGKTELVEFHHSEFLFLKPLNSPNPESRYVVRHSPEEGWTHFIRSALHGDIRGGMGQFIIEAYREGISAVYSFEHGRFLEYRVIPGDGQQLRRVLLSSRAAMTASCESMCHALDCAGRKFEEKSTLEQFKCASNLIVCMSILVLDCVDEGCANSWVESCDHH